MSIYQPGRGCPKCGCDTSTDRYCTGYYPSACWSNPIVGASKPHIHRTCGRCRYEWAEAPLDSQPAAPSVYKAPSDG